MTQIIGKSFWGEAVGLRVDNFGVPKQSLWRGPRLWPPNGFDKLTPLVPMRPLTYIRHCRGRRKRVGDRGMRPFQFKSLEGMSPETSELLHFFKAVENDLNGTLSIYGLIVNK